MTSVLERQVVADKAFRDGSKLAFDTRLGEVKQDLSARGIGGRIADEVADRAKMIFDEGADVVHEHPAAVGGTIIALMLWLLRNPIIRGIDKLRDSRR